MVAVSVLVPTPGTGDALRGLLRSIDAQTLAADAFTLIAVDAAAGDDLLRRFAGRRPNVTLVAADPESTEAQRLAIALTTASSPFVLHLRDGQRLAPRALELLVDCAERGCADVVLGRARTSAASGCAEVPDDTDAGATPDGPTAHLALVRRALIDGQEEPGAALTSPIPLVADGRVGAVGRYACAHDDQDLPLAAPTGPPSCRWSEGLLHIAVAIGRPVPPGGRAWIVLHRDATELAIPAPIADGTAAAAIDPVTAEGGSALASGAWTLALRVTGPDGETTAPLSAAPAASAVVAGRPYVLEVEGGALCLDAGATVGRLTGRVPVSEAWAVESGHGTLVTVRLPAVHVHGDAVLDARVLLDRFGLPARLVCAGGAARIEAWVGSLAGTSVFAIEVGGVRAPTGLLLRIDDVGRLSFERRRPTPPPPAQAPRVQRLRRRLPAVAEPTVLRLAQIPALRRAYRRLLSR